MTKREIKTAKIRSTSNGDECVLLLEGNQEDAARILGELAFVTDQKLRVECLTELSGGIERLRRGGVGAVLLDMTLPDSHGIETFDKLFEVAPRVPILILTAADAEASARQAVQRGAYDYVLKNQSDGYRLRRTVRTLIGLRATAAMSLKNE